MPALNHLVTTTHAHVRKNNLKFCAYSWWTYISLQLSFFVLKPETLTLMCYVCIAWTTLEGILWKESWNCNMLKMRIEKMSEVVICKALTTL